MDPLTITTSIFGLLKATAQVAQYLGPYVSAVKDIPKIVTQVHSEVVYSRTILLALDGLTKNLDSVPVERAALIQIDQLVAIFTDGVLLFSEIESSLPSLPSPEPTTLRLPLQTRLKWAWKESTFTALLTRLQGFKSSIALMLTILQSDSDLRAAGHQHELSQNVAALLKSNQSLSRRLMNLEDVLETRTITPDQHSLGTKTSDISNHISKSQQLGEAVGELSLDRSASQLSRPSEDIASGFDFEDDLEASRVYRRAQRDTMDFSFRSSVVHTNAWSVFSGRSLGDVSIISAIALPLYREELTNAQHYGVDNLQRKTDTVSTPNVSHAKPLYDDYLEVELRLSQIPGISEMLATAKDSGGQEDSITFLIRFFRLGTPLLMLLEKPIGCAGPTYLTQARDSADAHSISEAAISTFIQACINDFGFQPDDCFSVNDLTGNCLTGYSKVIRVITRLLDIFVEIGSIKAVDLIVLLPEKARRWANPSLRETIIERFLMEERSYVANLEKLLELNSKAEVDSSLHKEILNKIRSSLESIVDLQRQFLLRVEMTARKPPNDQIWVIHFEDWSKMSSIYAKFIASENGPREYIRIVVAEQKRADKIDLNSSLPELLRLVYLPSQCLPRYLGLLQELRRQGGLSDSQLNDISDSIRTLYSAVPNIDAAIKHQELHEAETDLLLRVQDWKGHSPQKFGILLLSDTVHISEGNSDVLRLYRAYLFEKIIIICRDIAPWRIPTRSRIFSRTKDKKTESGTSLKLCGRIYIKDVIVNLCISKQGSYVCKILWDTEVSEKISIKFATESKMETWHEKIEELRKSNAQNPSRLPNRAMPSFHWTTMIENPYKDTTYLKDSDDEDTPSILAPVASNPVTSDARLNGN